MRDCKGIKILLGICPSSHRSEDLLPSTFYLLPSTGGLLESETEPRELSAGFVFCCPGFQHNKPLVTSPVLGFLRVQLLS